MGLPQLVHVTSESVGVVIAFSSMLISFRDGVLCYAPLYLLCSGVCILGLYGCLRLLCVAACCLRLLGLLSSCHVLQWNA